MKGSRALLVMSACWQILRFVLIGLIAVAYVNPGFTAGKSILILWPASAELLLAACLIFLAIDQRRYAVFRNLAILGKVLDIVPGVVLFAYQLIGVFTHRAFAFFTFVPLVQRFAGRGANVTVVFTYLVALVVILDLIVLLVLLSGRDAGGTDSGDSGGEGQVEDDRPDLVEIDLSE